MLNATKVKKLKQIFKEIRTDIPEEEIYIRCETQNFSQNARDVCDMVHLLDQVKKILES